LTKFKSFFIVVIDYISNKMENDKV
jgi:hypothetical protein